MKCKFCPYWEGGYEMTMKGHWLPITALHNFAVQFLACFIKS